MAERAVTFDAFRFDLASERLWSRDSEVRLTPKAAAVLKVLVANAGHTVSKDELFEAVWGETAVGDDSLTSCVQELRKALGDDPKQPRYIETRHRRGYQFVGVPSAAWASASSALSVPVPVEAAGLAIAVLPFADMSPARDHDYLCEGLSEELINALTHVDGLRVASRTASFQFRGGADVADVGRRLGVSTLLEGSVRVTGNRLRVTVQLIDVNTGYHRWSERFDRTLDDVFAIQDDIARHVATSLCGTILSDAEQQGLRRPPTRAEAYEYYLRGRQFLPRTTRQDLGQAADMFQRAIGVDPGYGPAYAGLATVYAVLHEWWGASEEDLRTAERASQRASELAPHLAETHVARGFLLSLTGRFSDAQRSFEDASRINPQLFDAYYYYGRAAFGKGETALARDLFAKAARVRLEDFQSPSLEALCLQRLGRHDEAEARTREALARAERVLALNPNDVRALAFCSSDLVEVGQVERALEWSSRALQLAPDDVGVLINGACLRAKLGQHDEALDLLERAFAHGRGKKAWLEHDPDLDSLRTIPRFQRLLADLK